MARFSQALLQGLMRPAFQQELTNAAKGLGATPGMLVANRQAAERKKAMASAYGAAIDPAATSAEVGGAAQQMLDLGNIDQALSLGKDARALAAKEQETAALNARKEAVAKRADALGLPAVAEAARAAPDNATLDNIAGDLRQTEIKRLPSQTPGQRMARARAAGITPDEFNNAGLATATDDFFEKYVTGQKGKTEAWADDKGNVKAVRFNEAGKAWDEDSQAFVEPSALGLVQKAPSVQKVIDASNKMIEALADESVKDIVNLRDKARTAKAKVDVLNRQLGRLEGGMPTGIAANIQVGLAQVGQLMGMPYNPNLVNAQEYMMEVANLVKQEIKAFGSGTSITDADREYTQRMVGGDITQQAEALENMLKIYKEAAEGTIRDYNKVVQGTANKVGAENMGSFQEITLPAGGLSPAAQRYVTGTGEG